MGRIDVRVPDGQERAIDALSKEEYRSRSEFVREAIRNEIRERIDLKQVREAEARLEDEKADELPHEEVEEKAGLQE